MPVEEFPRVDGVMSSSVVHAQVGPGLRVALGLLEPSEKFQELFLAGGLAQHVGWLDESRSYSPE